MTEQKGRMQNVRAILSDMKYLWKLSGHYRKRQTAILALMIGAILASAATPFLIELLINNVSTGNVVFTRNLLVFLVLSQAGLFVLSFAGRYFIQVLGYQCTTNLQADLLTKFLHAPYSSEEQLDKGSVLSKIISDAASVGSMSATWWVNGLAQLVWVAIGLVVLFIISPFLTLLSLVIIPLFFLSVTLLSGRTKKASRKERLAYSSSVGNLSESLGSYGIAKRLSSTERFVDSYKDRLNSWFAKTKPLSAYTLLSSTIQYSLAIFLSILLLGIGALLVVGGSITLGAVVGFASYAPAAFGQLPSLASVYQSIIIIHPMIDRVSEIQALPEEKLEGLPFARPLVRFVGVGLEVNRRVILDNVSFVLREGVTALVGPNGAGKTSIASLMIGLIDPSNGSITIDGIDLRKIDKRELRRKIICVSSNDNLVNATVEQNVTLGDEFSSIEVSRSLAMVGLDQMEAGRVASGLSQGEMQKITIARALIRKPEVLVLDEASSSIDPQSEEEILTRLPTLGIKGVLLITQRSSSIFLADRVIEMDSGRIVAERSRIVSLVS